MQLGLEPSLKDMSSMIGSIAQIREGAAGFLVDLKHEFWGSFQVYYLNIKVEKLFHGVSDGWDL